MTKYILQFLLFVLPCAADAQSADTLQANEPVAAKFGVEQSFNRNISYAGLMFIADGLIVKAQKNDFRTLNTYFKPHTHEPFVNCMQYSPLAATFALKAAGVKSKSNWTRMTVNSALSYALMAGMAFTLKHSVSEMRPDHTERNSFPSGHTATAFCGATILYKEYGHLSPWYGVAGYTLATATGLTRILNNRHWMSDVLVGAGIGVVATDLGYFLGDLLMKGKGVDYTDKDTPPDLIRHPSFISMTIGSGFTTGHLSTPDINDSYDANGSPVGHKMDLKLKSGRLASFNLEGAYYLNDYIGVGGRVRVMSLPLVAESYNHDFTYIAPSGTGTSAGNNAFTIESVESAHLGMFDFSAGVFASCPLGNRLRVGTKLLAGNRLTTDYSVDALFRASSETTQQELDKHKGTENDWVNFTGGEVSRDSQDPDLYHDHNFLKIKSNNTLTIGTGVDVTYAYKRNMSMRAFIDYDYARPKYTFELNNRYDAGSQTSITDTYYKSTTMSHLSGGVGLAVNF